MNSTETRPFHGIFFPLPPIVFLEKHPVAAVRWYFGRPSAPRWMGIDRRGKPSRGLRKHGFVVGACGRGSADSSWNWRRIALDTRLTTPFSDETPTEGNRSPDLSPTRYIRSLPPSILPPLRSISLINFDFLDTSSSPPSIVRARHSFIYIFREKTGGESREIRRNLQIFFELIRGLYSFFFFFFFFSADRKLQRGILVSSNVDSKDHSVPFHFPSSLSFSFGERVGAKRSEAYFRAQRDVLPSRSRPIMCFWLPARLDFAHAGTTTLRVNPPSRNITSSNLCANILYPFRYTSFLSFNDGIVYFKKSR